RSWQARRIDGFAETPMASNTKASRPEGRGSLLRSLRTRIRHVEQRARPPQTLACGILKRRLVSRTLKPFGTRPCRFGYVTVIMPLWRSRNPRTPRATKTRAIAPQYAIGK